MLVLDLFLPHHRIVVPDQPFYPAVLHQFLTLSELLLVEDQISILALKELELL
jgi:hypothetical protein